MENKPSSVKKKILPEDSPTTARNSPNTAEIFTFPKPTSQSELFELVRRQTFNRWYNKNILHPEARIRVLFGILQKTVKILNLRTQTFCLTVHIFDAMISKFPISKEQMFPMGLVAMQMASKIHESQGQLVSYGDINKFIFPFGVKEFCKIEQTIVKHLDFRINLVSPNEILLFLLDKFFKEEYEFFAPFNDSRENKKKIISLIFKLHLITLVEYEFYKYTSLAVAVSIIIFSRLCLNLNPWTEKMKNFVGISQKHVEECLKMLYQRYNDNYITILFQELDQNQEQPENSNSSYNSALSSSSPLEQSQDYFLSDKTIKKYLSTLDTAVPDEC